MEQKVIIIGGVGSGTVIAQAIRHAHINGDKSLLLEGFMSHILEPGEMIENIPVIVKQSAENVKLYWEKGYKFIFALHRTDGEKEFIKLFHDLNLKPEMLATFIHPTAYIAPNVKIASGCVIMPYAMITSDATIGYNSLIMIGAIKSATRFITLISGFKAGPAVSLNGSPTVSPITAALCLSVPLKPICSTDFFALSHAPPAFER